MFGDFEYTQRTNSSYASLHYTILAAVQNITEEVTLFAEGPCHNGGNSIVINVEILPCPPGFQARRLNHSNNQIKSVCVMND